MATIESGLRVLATALCFTVAAGRSCHGWSPCVHGMIALGATEELPTEKRDEFLRLVQQHPQYEEMIASPPGTDPEDLADLTIVRAATWADRLSGTEHERADWHFFSQYRILDGAFPYRVDSKELPQAASMNTRELNLVQAVKLCLLVLEDKTRPEGERAVALCWITNLIGDAHQPLHCAGLYIDSNSIESDDHGRSISVGNETLYDVVDNLVCSGDELLDVRRELAELRRTLGTGISSNQPVDYLVQEAGFNAAAFIYPIVIPSVKEAVDRGEKEIVVNLAERDMKKLRRHVPGYVWTAISRLRGVLEKSL